VVKNFHYQSLHEKVNPIFFKIHYTWKGGNILVRIKAGNEKATLEQLRKVYAAYNPGFPFEFRFMDEAYQALYVAELRVAVLSRYFAAIAILISCLGLFGLASFTAQRRKKEIGIRKVLGSGEWHIVQLLSAEFTKMILVSIALALPLSFLIASKWLEAFAYSIALEWWYFALTGILALLIAWLTVGTQAIKAARANPIQTLREE
jgi:ABC-type antimicrobial peptide transport system permease subunit